MEGIVFEDNRGIQKNMFPPALPGSSKPARLSRELAPRIQELHAERRAFAALLASVLFTI